MKTTSLVIEYLVSGILLLCSIALLFCSYHLEYVKALLQSWPDVWQLKSLESFSILIATLTSATLTAVAYWLGVVAEPVARFVFEYSLQILIVKVRIGDFSKFGISKVTDSRIIVEFSLGSRTLSSSPRPILRAIGHMRFSVLRKSPELYTEIQSQLDRLRLIRIFVIVEFIILIGLFKLSYTVFSPEISFLIKLVAILLALNIFTVSSRLNRYCRSVERSYMILMSGQPYGEDDTSGLDGYISNALNMLNFRSQHLYEDILKCLFLISLEDLKAAEVGNPVVHNLIVLRHVLQIGLAENIDLLQAGAVAILHDIAPIPKIRKADIGYLNESLDKQSEEDKRKHHRRLHMQEGSRIAREKLSTLNQYYNRDMFKQNDINIVCKCIEIHDNPSIDIPISSNDRLAVVFREADRLWMLSDEGFAADLKLDAARLGRTVEDPELVSKRIEHILTRYKEERNLYKPSDGPFVDDLYFFRTRSGYAIFQEYLTKRRYKIPS